jgi:hypothetical protein
MSVQDWFCSFPLLQVIWIVLPLCCLYRW